MARPAKKGLDYFPLDCNADKKLKAVIRKFGAEGFGVVVGLLQHIYSEGYFVKWTIDLAEDFALEMNVDEVVLDDVLSFCIKRGIFNNELFKKEKVLTSAGIQKRYLLATERRKCSHVEYYNLINVDINSLDVDNNGVNDSKSTQSKVKESKVKESKEETPISPLPDIPTLVSTLLQIHPRTGKYNEAERSVLFALNDLKENKGHSHEEAVKLLMDKTSRYGAIMSKVPKGSKDSRFILSAHSFYTEAGYLMPEEEWIQSFDCLDLSDLEQESNNGGYYGLD